MIDAALAARTAVTALGGVAALPGLLAAAHLTTLSAGALAWRPPSDDGPVVPLRLLVLIPAHDEQSVLPGTLAALGGAVRDRDRVLVVADHCSDGTAAIARDAGASVLERGAGTVAGRAEARQDGLELALQDDDWDAVVFLDADSVVAPDFLDACERGLARADALQARSEALPAGGVLGHAATAAFSLQGVTLPRGRDALGLAPRLRGTGMVVRREVAARHRLRAAVSEDLVYTIDLLCDGVRPRHLDDARLRSMSTTSRRTAGSQRMRWEAGRLAVARAEVGRLLRRPTPARLEVATHLLTPPIALAMLSLLVGLLAGVAAGASWLVVATAVGLAALALDVVVALALARVGPRTWLSLAAAPWYVLWKSLVQVRALASVRAGRTSYPATTREVAP